MLRGIRHPARTVFSSPERTRRHQTRETEFTQLITNYKVRHIITTYTDIQLCAQLNHKCNVNVSPYKNPRTRPYSIPIMQWHDRWRPHASQWPKPAYHFLLLPWVVANTGWHRNRCGTSGPTARANSVAWGKLPYVYQ